MALTIQENKDLHPFNTFGIHVLSRYFAALQAPEALQQLLQNPKLTQLPKLILGGGSNILFTDNFPGLVIKNEIKGIQVINEDEKNIFIKIGAGENWHEFVMHCIANDWSGIENLSLIPGTVGAAPIQNIGAYGVELNEVFHELEAFNMHDGSIKIFNKNECAFGYRDSVFKHQYKNQYFITYVTLRLNKIFTPNTEYSVLRELLEQRHIKEFTLKDISDAVIEIRRSKLPDPKVIGNAGSFFKNPLISISHFEKLKTQFEKIPFYSESSELVKIPAAWLIEQCGWKGKRIGDIGVHDKQALVLVNYGTGSGTTLRELATQIQSSVLERFGIELTPEVNIL
jgi:UDP-N-acetylmuramate dehydrogenase